MHNLRLGLHANKFDAPRVGCASRSAVESGRDWTAGDATRGVNASNRRALQGQMSKVIVVMSMKV
jgi:hypothetical protein